MGRQSEFWLRLGRGAAGVLFPHYCVECGREGSVICDDCRLNLSARKGVFKCPGCAAPSVWGAACSTACRSRTSLDGVMSAAAYAETAAREALHLYKYSGILEAGRAISGVLGGFAARSQPVMGSLLGLEAVIMPVPLHPWREAWRGFNQAGTLATAVAAPLGLPVRSLLRRRFGWKRQTQLDSPLLRHRNVERMIFLEPGTRVPESVLLIDDVFTTGATLSVCARVLRARGAKRVWGLTLLRG